jgi:hypothetical protein
MLFQLLGETLAVIPDFISGAYYAILMAAGSLVAWRLQ